ncbi:MAG: CHAT domain-containing protein, partial [Candidatus Solibacter sp.]|nr:CHAT domain-containing protein [Candidatus Solibacter sp.]
VERVDGRRAVAPPTVVLVARRAAAPGDAARLDAVRLSTEAKRLQGGPGVQELDAAAGHNREALRLWHELGEGSAEARTLLKMADILFVESRSAEAGAQYREAVRIAVEIGDVRIAAEGRNNAGLCALQLGELDEALDLLRQALSDWQALRLPYGESAAAVNLGLLAWRVGSFDEALGYQERALAAFLRLRERRGAALARNNLGLTYSSLNKPALALKQLQIARAEFHALGDAVAEGQALVNIGYLELLSNQTALAIRSQERAVALLKDGPDVRAKADAMTNLGRALADRSPLESLKLLSGALALYQGIGDRRGQAGALHQLGKVHAAAGDTALGLDELDRAFRFRTDARIRDAAAESLFESARILEAEGRLEEAAGRFAEVVRITETLRTAAGGEGFRTSYFSSKQPYFEHYVSLLMRLGRPAEAFAVAERARGRSLLDTLASVRPRIASVATPALLARKGSIERRLSYQSQQLLSLTRAKEDAAREAALRGTIDELFAERDRVEREIRDSDPRYTDLWNPVPADLKDLQTLLDGETELLEFALGEPESYLWVVTNSELRSFTLPGRATLEATARTVVNLAADFRKREQDAKLDRRFQGLLARVGRQLFGAAAASVSRKRWVVVPDGMLHYLPFAAVRLFIPPRASSAGGNEIVVLPSASVLAMLRRNQKLQQMPEGTIAIFADPVFDQMDPRVPVADASGRASAKPIDLPQPTGVRRLARLPFSGIEAQEVATLAPPKSALVLVGFDASKARLMSPAVGRYRILHLSTHATLDDVHPELSRITLAQVDRLGKPVDGVLRLYEIYNLRLPATDLVVLSACESGAGHYVSGEGLIGFAHGFFHAGAGGVLATLWAVEDEASKELVRRFYQALLVRHLKPSAALAAAQQGMRAESRWHDPYYWAGFVLVSGPG